eukprot:TRINITY_DN3655_c0_g1_i1.p1 TRINITY_DN3655_c0_g1~~TRINITY_DN3655_c0_g1_i1.p1  ORF type:complete len:116 (-),score=38.07 TRINITY_DN3655_c0_g1_i1:143-490(-)
MGLGSKLITVLGAAILIHSGFLAFQHRLYLSSVEEPFTTLPLNITIEVLIGLVVSSWGVIGWSGQFKPIKMTTIMAQKTFDMFDNRPNFNVFNTRGRAVPAGKNKDKKDKQADDE